MVVEKIILYYQFVPLPDPDAICLWQKTLAESNNLKGRILISNSGINGTLGGSITQLKQYIKATSLHPLFHDMEYKWSDGSQNDFPRLSVKVRDETVTLGSDDTIQVNDHGVIGGGDKIKPAMLDDFIDKHPEAVLFDGRNNYESAIGKFKNAIIPNVNHFREFPDELNDPKYDELKNKPVITYCTGGIRCETLSVLMKRKGFKKVFQLEGGIVTYGEVVGDDGLWEGKCFVFDKRMSIAFSGKSKDIGSCAQCSNTTSRYINCANKQCNRLILMCEQCLQQKTCSEQCEQLVTQSA
jgi:UPF0176 protein